MKASQHTAEQIIKILEQAEKGDQTIGAICRTNGIAENTFYRWRKTYGGMSVSEAQRLKELEKENTAQAEWLSACPVAPDSRSPDEQHIWDHQPLETLLCSGAGLISRTAHRGTCQSSFHRHRSRSTKPWRTRD